MHWWTPIPDPALTVHEWRSIKSRSLISYTHLLAFSRVIKWNSTRCSWRHGVIFRNLKALPNALKLIKLNYHLSLWLSTSSLTLYRTNSWLSYQRVYLSITTWYYSKSKSSFEIKLSNSVDTVANIQQSKLEKTNHI